jgi:hypothetical protein
MMKLLLRLAVRGACECEGRARVLSAHAATRIALLTRKRDALCGALPTQLAACAALLLLSRAARAQLDDNRNGSTQPVDSFILS